MSETVYLIWAKEGEWDDPSLLAARKNPDSAKAWCNEERKLDGGDPVSWTSHPDGWVSGVSRIPQGKRFYYIQPMKVEE